MDRNSVFVTQRAGVQISSNENKSSQSTLLLEKKKEMQEVQLELDRKREQFRERMQKCKELERKLASKQEEIRSQMERFKKFLTDNDAKRARANRKASEEIKQRQQKEDEIISLKQKLDQLKETKERVQLLVKRLSPNLEYLEKVAEASDEFPTVSSLLTRHKSLSEADEDQLNYARELEVQTEKIRLDMANFIKENQNVILIRNSDLAQLQKKLEEVKSQGEVHEADLASKQKLTKDRVRRLGEIKMAANNLYSRCRVKHSSENEPLLAKLDVVAMRICDLREIVASAEGRF